MCSNKSIMFLYVDPRGCYTQHLSKPLNLKLRSIPIRSVVNAHLPSACFPVSNVVSSSCILAMSAPGERIASCTNSVQSSSDCECDILKDENLA
jgi:hypothetical protein